MTNILIHIRNIINMISISNVISSIIIITIAFCLLPLAYCLLPIAYCLLASPYWLFPIGPHEIVCC